ncbi:hypothetical protein BZG02_12810 [Labilibaculum filiforme]|uniref:Uncharacterized protein n=1 Tax=Labilibaculum filiforme TaxID=1940526 RepID=A0A2N3HX16_9BACT|nr:hypothetical protein BZG02_12810 [Labilibaculum filiforme]
MICFPRADSFPNSFLALASERITFARSLKTVSGFPSRKLKPEKILKKSSLTKHFLASIFSFIFSR